MPDPDRPLMELWEKYLDAFGWVLAALFSVVPSLGVAIILLTIGVRLLLFPLTAKQARSMMEMQRIQPEVKRIQAKYKQDRQKLNEELMKVYKEHQVNPFGGCLPLLAQMPIFIGLYQVLRNMPRHVDPNTSLYQLICPDGPSGCDPKDQDIGFLGIPNLFESASSITGGFVTLFPYLVLIGLVMVTAYYQQRQTMRRQTQPNPQMQMISRIFPVIFAFISWSIPAGVVLYFFVSNLWQIGQQEIVYRRIYLPAQNGERPAAKSGGSGGLFGRMLRAAESGTPAPPDSGAGGAPDEPGAATGDSDSTQGQKGRSPNGGGSAGGRRSGGARSGGQGKRRNNRKRRR